MFNLISDQLISVGVKTTDGEVRQQQCALPEIYILAQQDRINCFSKLRPHQWQAWHCLLVQLAALAVVKADLDSLPETEADWAAALWSLTAEFPDDEPWQLVVDNWQQPAFLQMPTPAGSENDFKQQITASDQLDMLVTSKNHDVKTGAARSPTLEDWLYALVNLQTTEGFLGAGNYGISRMNGGFSGRSFIGLAPLGGVGIHIIRDATVLVSQREDFIKHNKARFPKPAAGLGLVHLQPWDGTTSLAITSLDPYYIESCRRVRFQNPGDSVADMVVKIANSKKARIDAAALKGNTGDPWAPLERGGEGKALTLDGRGYHYRRVYKLVFDGSWVLPLLARPVAGECGQEMVLVLSTFVRGQGKTEGLQQRRIPAGHSVIRMFGKTKILLADLAKAFISDAKDIQKALRTSVQILSSGAPMEEAGRIDLNAITDEDRARSNAASDQFDLYGDQYFFEPLFQRWEASGDHKSRLILEWRYQLLCYARKLLDEAGVSLPKTRYHRRARVEARRYFDAVIYKNPIFSSWLSEHDNSTKAKTTEVSAIEQ